MQQGEVKNEGFFSGKEEGNRIDPSLQRDYGQEEVARSQGGDV